MQVSVVHDDGVADEDIEKFLRFLAAQEFSPNTIRAYAYDLAKLLTFLQSHDLTVGQFTPPQAVEFLAWLRNARSRKRVQRHQLGVVTADGQRKLSGSTCNRTLAAISTFYEFLISAGRYDNIDNPLLRQVDTGALRVPHRYRSPLMSSAEQRPIRRVVRVRTVEPLPRPIDDAVYEKILEAVTKLRDRALLELMRESGLRPGEALGLKLEDIAYGRRRVTVRHRDDHPAGARQKSRRERVVDLYEDRALPAINRYVMLERPRDAKSPYVFLVGGRGKRSDTPLSYNGMFRMFTRAADRAGVRDPLLTPHSLRHTHATRMIELGMQELTLSARLGHASPDSTRIYTRVTASDVLADYKAAVLSANKDAE
ncbi:tyrosine-type recombinase/integrase [Mycobacteroides abscessus]|uniref:tyrosine-type recombinase/integrase n=1 Tax=Mycobacteroides abscessus TaxID=36809 RepID=UPI000D3EAB1B|nr:tyrosine-type recombinase/integrase [Mycobacteroides abscessus]PVA70175.1 transposase [Mycobacteroides abscessus]